MPSRVSARVFDQPVNHVTLSTNHTLLYGIELLPYASLALRGSILSLFSSWQQAAVQAPRNEPIDHLALVPRGFQPPPSLPPPPSSAVRYAAVSRFWTDELTFSGHDSQCGFINVWVACFV